MKTPHDAAPRDATPRRQWSFGVRVPTDNDGAGDGVATRPVPSAAPAPAGQPPMRCPRARIPSLDGLGPWGEGSATSTVAEPAPKPRGTPRRVSARPLAAAQAPEPTAQPTLSPRVVMCSLAGHVPHLPMVRTEFKSSAQVWLDRDGHGPLGSVEERIRLEQQLKTSRHAPRRSPRRSPRRHSKGCAKSTRGAQWSTAAGAGSADMIARTVDMAEALADLDPASDLLAAARALTGSGACATAPHLA